MAGGSNNSPCPESTWGPSQQPSGQSGPAEEAAWKHDRGPAATRGSHGKYCSDNDAQTSPQAWGLVTDDYQAGQRQASHKRNSALLHGLFCHLQGQRKPCPERQKKFLPPECFIINRDTKAFVINSDKRVHSFLRFGVCYRGAFYIIRGSTLLPLEQKRRANEIILLSREFGNHSESEAGASVFLVHRATHHHMMKSLGACLPETRPNQTQPNPAISAGEGRGRCGGS